MKPPVSVPSAEFVLEEINRASLETVIWSPYYDAVHKQLARELLKNIEVHIKEDVI